MKNLLSDRKVQLGLGAAVLLGVLWLLVGGSDQVDEATITETPAEVVAPSNVDAVIGNTETTNTVPINNAEADKATNENQNTAE